MPKNKGAQAQDIGRARSGSFLRRGERHHLLATLLAVVGLSPSGAWAQTTTWLGVTSPDLGLGINWSSGVPTASTTAIFDAGGQTTLSSAGPFSAQGLQFNAADPGRSIYINSSTFAIGSGGINRLGGGQLFTIAAGATVTIAGPISTAGQITVVDGTLQPNTSMAIENHGQLTFSGNATAGSVLFEDAGVINFTGSSSAGSAGFFSLDGGVVNFRDNSSGGQAIFGGVFNTIDISQLTTTGTTIGSLTNDIVLVLGDKQLTVGANNLSTPDVTITFTGGAGSLVKVGTGTLTLQTNGPPPAGGIVVLGGGLQVWDTPGGIMSDVSVGPAGVLGGGGNKITGNVVNNGTVVTNSVAGSSPIATFTITGSYTQTTSGSYRVNVTPTQGDRIDVGGTATLGGTINVLPRAGSYARGTTYTVLSATGGVSGAYAGVSGTVGLMTPTLSYDGGNVLLTLVLPVNAFAAAGQTASQRAVGAVLDQAAATATGDLATVITSLANLSGPQAAAVMGTLGGQSYAGFSSVAVFGAQNFMNAFSQQAGGGQGGGSIALAEACDVAACDVEGRRWGAWGGGVGAFGTVAGDANAPGLTYNLGGFAAGLDYRFSPNFLAGVTAGYNAATLYPQGTSGQGQVGTVQLGLYGEYTAGPLYLDGLAGYARSDNRMMRQIVIPGLNLRTAWGQTHADQLFGQIEAGYKLTVAPSFGGFVTPFARLQGSTSTLAGFTESGADSLNLVVASQTTNSLRSVLGAQLGAAIDTGWHDKLDLVLRLGWSHEYADTDRPVSAAFAGAPATTFTTQGAAAPRDGVILGLGAKTAIAEATSLYLRYDGDLAGANTNHVLSAGVRLTW